MNVKSLFWFFVGFVFVNFASSLWLLLSSVLTITPIPSPIGYSTLLAISSLPE